MISVFVNGEEKKVEKKINLSEFLSDLSLPTERIAVELNREVVRRGSWNDTMVDEGDRLEIVHFVGGG